MLASAVCINKRNQSLSQQFVDTSKRIRNRYLPTSLVGAEEGLDVGKEVGCVYPKAINRKSKILLK